MVESLTLQAQEEKLSNLNLKMNIQDTVNKGINILKKGNIANPYLDSEIILCSVNQ